MTKKILIALGVIVITGIMAYAIFSNISESNIKGVKIQSETLAGLGYEQGTSTIYNLTKMPVSYVDANSTTTDGTRGGYIQQMIETNGVSSLQFMVKYLSGTATSTLSIKPMVSVDGISWFPVSATSTATNVAGTSTLALNDRVISLPDIAANTTTTKSFTMDIPPSNFVRLEFYGEDVVADPNDGVYAFIQVAKVFEN